LVSGAAKWSRHGDQAFDIVLTAQQQ
jgi:hypothetical protein